MQKGKFLYLIIILFLIGIGLISVPYLNTFFIKLRVKELKPSCYLPVISRKDKDISLFISYANNKEISEITYFFDLKENGRYMFSFKGRDWIKLYFTNNEATQVKFLPRLWPDDHDQICRIEQTFIYLTGIVPNTVVVKKGGSYLVYPNKEHFKAFNRGTYTSLTFPKVQTILEDGTKIKVYTFTGLFENLQEYIKDPLIYDEGLNVQVFNATDKDGYATFWGRLLQGIGFRVTHISTLNYLFDKISANKNYLIYINPEYHSSYSYKILKELFGSKAQFTSSRPKGVLATADVIIILVK